MDATPDWQIKVVYEDEDILAVSKPSGLSVHAESGDSLESVLAVGRKGRPLILLHRLDKETTGIVLFAKRKPAAGEMSRAFEEKRIRKVYIAVVDGNWAKKLTRAESLIGRDENGVLHSTPEGPGKKALTTFRVLLQASDRTLIEAMPKTGRTHQIRLHCAGLGHAILGDRRYGRPALQAPGGQALHAYRVDFQHPMTKLPVRIVDLPPASWNETWFEGFSLVELELWKSKSSSDQ